MHHLQSEEVEKTLFHCEDQMYTKTEEGRKQTLVVPRI